jgi:hypothetical protein
VLSLSFTADELAVVLKDTKTNMASGPHGLLVSFFKSFWPTVKHMVMQILNGFSLGSLVISCLNYEYLLHGVNSTRQYRQIAQINVVFKLVFKACATRLIPVANWIMSPSQTAFIKGRFCS